MSHEGHEVEEIEVEEQDDPMVKMENELRAKYKEYMSDPENVKTAVDYMYESLLDFFIFGEVLDYHFMLKSGVLEALEGEAEDPTENQDSDVWGTDTSINIDMEVNCIICKKKVAASRFAPHLQKCMGLFYAFI